MGGRAQIIRQWADGEMLQCVIAVDDSYPQTLDQAKATCERMYANALDITLRAAEADEADDTDVV